MRMVGLKCSIFGFELCKTMTKSTRLQMTTFGYLKLNSLFCRWTILRSSAVPTGEADDHSSDPSTQPLAGHTQSASNTTLELCAPVVPTVRVVSTKVPAGPPTPVFSFGLFSIAHTPAPTNAPPFGPIVVPLPRYTASYNLRLTEIEPEFGAWLLNTLLPSIRRY